MEITEAPFISRLNSRYEKIVRITKRPPDQRTRREMRSLEEWFRQKSKLLRTLNEETLLDVIQHCEFVTREKDDVIIHQGEKGHRFYIVLRGSVAVLLKEALEDVVLGEEGTNTKAERASLGNQIATLGEGAPFGEIALMNADCIRTASVIADERTDLVVIHRDLYNRSVKKVVAREYSEKIGFIESVPLIQQWMPKFRKQLAACFKREVLPFDCTLFRQGDPATDIYFIVKGEVKLVVDPEAHYQQYDKFMDRCGNVIEGQTDVIKSDKAYFPQKLLPQLAKFTRINKASRLKRHGNQADPTHGDSINDLPQSWSPSAIRKMNSQISSKKVMINLCYLGAKQCVGDIEALLGLDKYHGTAVCSQETVVMVLHRSHFERLFKKRNPRSTKDMAHMLELQITRRMIKPKIVESVPLLRCFIYKLQETYSDRRVGIDGDEAFSLPTVSFEAQTARGASHAHHRDVTRGYSWAAAARAMGGTHAHTDLSLVKTGSRSSPGANGIGRTPRALSNGRPTSIVST